MKHFPALPHDDIQRHFDGIWSVRGAIKLPIALPMTFSRRMTIVRNADGESLTVVNSMRLTDAGHDALDALGKVTHVIRLAGAHGRDDAFYREHYGAQVLAIEGQKYSRGLKPGAEEFMQPDEALTVDSTLPVADARLHVITSTTPPEGHLLIAREGGVLVSGDVLQNIPPTDPYVGFIAKIAMKRMGFFRPYNIGPGWLKAAKPKAADVRSLLELEFDHVLPGHGEPVLGGAHEKYRPALEGPLEGAVD